jgi:hypothetical protein
MTTQVSGAAARTGTSAAVAAAVAVAVETPSDAQIRCGHPTTDVYELTIQIP